MFSLKRVFIALAIIFATTFVVALAGLWTMLRGGVDAKPTQTAKQVAAFGSLATAGWKKPNIVVTNTRGETKILKIVHEVRSDVPKYAQVANNEVFVLRQNHGMSEAQEVVRIRADGSASVVYGGVIHSFRVAPDGDRLGIISDDALVIYVVAHDTLRRAVVFPKSSIESKARWVDDRTVEYQGVGANGQMETKSLALW